MWSSWTVLRVWTTSLWEGCSPVWLRYGLRYLTFCLKSSNRKEYSSGKKWGHNYDLSKCDAIFANHARKCTWHCSFARLNIPSQKNTFLRLMPRKIHLVLKTLPYNLEEAKELAKESKLYKMCSNPILIIFTIVAYRQCLMPIQTGAWGCILTMFSLSDRSLGLFWWV